MAKQILKPATLLSPLPAVLVTCGTVEKPNALTIAWTGIINSSPAMTYISVRPERWSHHIISESGEFVINVTNESLARAADFCGVRSGKDTDKFAEMELTALPASKISAPILEQSPISLECKVTEVKHLGSHDMFIAEIVAIQADDKYISADGKLDLCKAGIISYSQGEYFTQGKKIGHMGYSVKKNK